MRPLNSFILLTALALSAGPAGANGTGTSEPLDMFVGQTTVLRFEHIRRIAIGNPAVADTVSFPNKPDEILVNAKTAGITTLAVWDGSGDAPHDYRIRVSSQAAAYDQRVYRLRNYTLTTTEFKAKSDGRTIITKTETARVEYLAGMLKQVLGDRFTIDSTRNQVVLRGTPEEINIAVAVLDEIDRPLRQVLIEARVIEITEGELKQLGNYLIAQEGRNSATANLSGDTGSALSFTFDTFTDLASRFSITLDMLQTANVGRTLVHSKVAVLDGNMAWIQAGESLPVAVRDSEQGLVSFTYIDTGVILDVVTRVGEDNNITLWLRPEVSNVSGWVGNPNSTSETAAPIIDSRQVMSEVRLKDGESIIIGGLQNEERSTVRKKVPLLGDLPAIGSFFRKKSETVTKSELIISITPHILTGEEAAAYKSNYIDMSATAGNARTTEAPAAKGAVNNEIREKKAAPAVNDTAAKPEIQNSASAEVVSENQNSLYNGVFLANTPDSSTDDTQQTSATADDAPGTDSGGTSASDTGTGGTAAPPSTAAPAGPTAAPTAMP